MLCAYLRLPYDPDPGAVPGEGEDTADHARARAIFRAIREVRHTVIRIIGSHLRDDATVSWQGHDLDFTDVIFDGGDSSHAVFNTNRASFRGARFEGRTVTFNSARFKGGMVDFRGARFEGGILRFGLARFVGGTVTFDRAWFMGGTVDFHDVPFEGSTVTSDGAQFVGGTVTFTGATGGRRPVGLADGMADHLS